MIGRKGGFRGAGEAVAADGGKPPEGRAEEANGQIEKGRVSEMTMAGCNTSRADFRTVQATASLQSSSFLEHDPAKIGSR
jgi:hypothetical protein